MCQEREKRKSDDATCWQTEFMHQEWQKWRNGAWHPPILPDKTKDSKTNCSAGLQDYRHLFFSQNDMWLHECLELNSSILVELSLSLLCITTHEPYILYLKRHVVVLTRSKLWLSSEPDSTNHWLNWFSWSLMAVSCTDGRGLEPKNKNMIWRCIKDMETPNMLCFS